MVKKRKGFTLIELIVVLVVITIIALIATPLVMNIIRNSKESTRKRSIDNYGKSIELAITSYLLDNGKFPTEVSQLNIEYSGSKVECGVEYINDDASIYLEGCKVNGRLVDNYTYGKDGRSAALTLTQKSNPKTITNYTDGDIHEMYTFEHEATEQTPALTDYRYIGNSPNNYVIFNGNETWRIIGVFSVDDGNGNYEERVKLIRNESLGNKQWNSSNQNEWVGSSIQTYLNDIYTIDNKSSEMVVSSKIYLGGLNYYGCINCAPNGESFYISERSETTCDGRNTNWVGKISLMYPSDYIFTYAVGVDYTCYNTPGSCNADSGANPSSGWLYRSEYYQWTMTPNSFYGTNAFKVDLSGVVHNYASYVSNSNGASPVVYLKPEVKIKQGDGTMDNPYIFEL